MIIHIIPGSRAERKGERMTKNPMPAPGRVVAIRNEMALLPATDQQAGIAARLDQYVRDAQGTFAQNTHKALLADQRVFTAWCEAAGEQPLPASPQTVARFVDEMAEVKKPATVRRYVSSIAHQHRAAELDNPAISNVVRLALKRMGNQKGRDQQQAEGLTRTLVDRMLNAAGLKLGDLRDRALLAVAYDTLARRSELVALAVEDFRREADGSGSVIIRRSKTDQEGEGMARYLAPDTVRTLEEWLRASSIGAGPIFRAAHLGGRLGKPLHPNEVSVRFKAMAQRAGLPLGTVGRISAHSTRIGSAQDQAAAQGISDTAIMQSGGWKTPQMVARYTMRQATRRSGAARLAETQNRV